MLGRVKPQGSLLETRHARRHLVTKGSFYERLAGNGLQALLAATVANFQRLHVLGVFGTTSELACAA